MQMKRWSLIVLCGLGLGFSVYGKGGTLTTDSLKNATYSLPFLPADYVPVAQKTVTLVHGAYNWKSKDGSRELHTDFAGPNAFGRLNHHDIAAVILRSNFGGSGTLVSLSAMENRNGKPYNVSSVDLGDRTIVQSISIKPTEITLEIFTHGPNDAMCCPTLAEAISYRLAQTGLIEISKYEQFADARVMQTETYKKDDKTYAYLVLQLFNGNELRLIHSFIPWQVLPSFHKGDSVKYKPIKDGVTVIDSDGNTFDYSVTDSQFSP